MSNSPSALQLMHLGRITDRLCRNSKAQTLAEDVWRFFEFRLTCRFPTQKTEPSSRCHLEFPQFEGSRQSNDFSAELVIQPSHRQEEALTHELLHLNLVRLGYPRFWIREASDSDKGRLAGGITNLADHPVMLSQFKSMGYDERLFLGDSNLSEFGKQIGREIQELEPQLLNGIPDYTQAVSGCLASHSIRFDLVWVRLEGINA